ELLEQELERRAHIAMDAEIFRELPLAIELGVLGHGGDDVFAGGERADLELPGRLRPGFGFRLGWLGFCGHFQSRSWIPLEWGISVADGGPANGDSRAWRE